MPFLLYRVEGNKALQYLWRRQMKKEIKLISRKTFSIGEIIQMTEKVMEKIRSVKIRTKKNRNNIHNRGRQDRRIAFSKGGK